MAKRISDILLETRNSKRFNKSEMARSLGVASQLYGQYESGEVNPKTDFRLKFEEIYGISLIGLEEKTSKDKLQQNSNKNNGQKDNLPNDNEDVTLDDPTKGGNDMIDRILSMQERNSRAMENFSIAVKDLAEANLIQAKMLEGRISTYEQPPKERRA